MVTRVPSWKQAAGSLALTTTALFSTPTMAQQSEAVVGLEEITVTARRIEENVQRVPIAITALSQETLERQDLRSYQDFERTVPAFTVCCARGTFGFVSIRGVRGVIGYFAGVPVDVSGFGMLFDLQNVQVLKGPQGTLQGLSTNGGAILNEPRRPSDRFEGYVEGTLGDYGRRTIEGVFNVPIVPGKVLMRAGVVSSHSDGYIRNVATGTDLGDENYITGRLSLTVRPTEDIETYTVANYYRFHGYAAPPVLLHVNPNGNAARTFGVANMQAALATQKALGFYKVAGLNVEKEGFQRNLNLVNITSWNIGDSTVLKNIAGYQTARIFSLTDSDGTPFAVANTAPFSEPTDATPSWSEELQLQGKIFGDRLTYTVGTFHSGTHTVPGPTYSVAFGNTSGTINKSSALTRALYGQGNYDLSDVVEGLTFTAGYRYTWDKRAASSIRLTAAGAVASQFASSARFSKGSYTLGLSYQVAPDTMLFVTNSKGYSSGGFNLTAPPQLQKFGPESLNNVEVGIKSDWEIAGIQGRTNLSAFYGKYDDIQVNITQVVQTATGPVNAAVTSNAASAVARGIDLGLQILPTEDFEITANGGLLNTYYKRYFTLVNGVLTDYSKLPFTISPRWKYSIAGTYHLPIDASLGDLSITADWAWQHREYAGAVFPDPPKEDQKPSYGSLRLSAHWRDVWGTEGLSATMFLTNVTNNIYTNGGIRNYQSLGTGAEGIDPPRHVGVTLRYSF